MNNADLFVKWNQVLNSYFFPNDLEEDAEVSLYIDRETIDELGRVHQLGGYDDFLRIVLLSIKDRKSLYNELRRIYIGTNRPSNLKTKYSSKNLFDFATIFIDSDFYRSLDCPFLIYIVFAILMGSECFRDNRTDIGNYITEKIHAKIPEAKNDNDRTAFEILFDELSCRHPNFLAKKITEHPYIGLIRYQLGLSKKQIDILNKAMYSADLSDEIPYEMWIRRIRDYVDEPTKDLLGNSLREDVLKKRISDLRNNFDPIQYEATHHDEAIGSKGNFVLAVYEDDYDSNSDKLILLTDINNKYISDGHLTIEKGVIDRLGEYAQYNVNHVKIEGNDKAEMKKYTLISGSDEISSIQIGSIVMFSRFSNNYLIQTQYPQMGKETYLLVKENYETKFTDFLNSNGTPTVSQINDDERICKIFGEGWKWYVTKEIEILQQKEKLRSDDGKIERDGGIRCIGMNNVYLAEALPYFEFPEPINKDKLSVFINCEGKQLEESNYTLKIVDGNKLVFDLNQIEFPDHSLDISISLEYKTGERKKDMIVFPDSFSVLSHHVRYEEYDLFSIDMWGGVVTDDMHSPYLKGFELNNVNDHSSLEELRVYYASRNEFDTQTSRYYEIDVYNRQYYLVNLIAAVCSMRNNFTITETWLKKCIRYAATRFDVEVDSSLYRRLLFVLTNSGFINVDYDNRRFQPIPPTFIKTSVGLLNSRLYILAGAYTNKFICDLKNYCKSKKIIVIVRHREPIGNVSDDINSLIPPVILLHGNFKPQKFMEETGCQCMFFDNDVDISVDILNSVCSYETYENTLEFVSNDVFDTPLRDAEETEFPRIRKSLRVGYGSSRWIEKTSGSYYKISIPDLAWANLFCLYKKRKLFCIQDVNILWIRGSIHLPLMMQRVLFLSNFGRPEKRKAFICFNDDNNEVYFNEIKRYEIQGTLNSNRMQLIIRMITGRDGNNNPSVRSRCNYRDYKLSFWLNNKKTSQNPRSLLVLTNSTGCITYGFMVRVKKDNIDATGKKYDMKAYIKKDGNSFFQRVDAENANKVFSDFMATRRNWNSIRCIENDTMQLPPKEEYKIEKIEII